MKGVCVVGASKTGTTGLYSAVHGGLSATVPRCYGLFEKHSAELLQNLQRLAPHTPVVAKLLVTNGRFHTDLVTPFDKRVLIVRDPRDTLLSAALYYPVLAVNDGVDEERIEEYVQLIREKEEDPSSHSFLDLLLAVYRLRGRDVDSSTSFGRRFDLVMDYMEECPSFVVHYERFVQDDLADLSDHLGFEVRNTRPSNYSSIVLRSGGAGEWRHWYTESDVEHFRPMMADYLRRFGYEDEWGLAAEPRIDPAAGSEYVKSAVRKRRRQIELNQAEETTEDLLQQLRHRADEGAPGAAVKVVRRLRAEGGADHQDEIRERLLFAASCGHVGAMRELAAELENSTRSSDRERARAWLAEADAVQERTQLRKVAEGRDEVARLRKELARCTDEVRTMRSSKRWRVAGTLADGARRGPRGLASAARKVWRIAREG